MRATATAALVAIVMLMTACADDKPAADALGSLDQFDDVIVGERGCDEPDDSCARVFLFGMTTQLDEVLDLVKAAGYALEPVGFSGAQQGCKPFDPRSCAHVGGMGWIRVTLSYPAG